MPIIFHQTSKTFHLYNDKISYIFKILKNQQLGQLYYGAKIQDRENFDHLLEMAPRAMAVCTFEDDRGFSLEHVKQEFPVIGGGDFRIGAIDIEQENGSRILEFSYQDHRIMAGKKKLPDLPATYVENDQEAMTLEVDLYDSLIETMVTLSYTIFSELPAITRHVQINNQSTATLKLDHLMSMVLDLPDKDYTMIELTGAWSRERHIKKRILEHGIQAIGSLKGCSSNSFNPFVALARPDCNEHGGEVLGFSFVYSGNFLAQVEVDPFDVARVALGIHPHGFSWQLSPGENFVTPEAIMVYSNNGLNGMSQTYHQIFQNNLTRGPYKNKPRPILINNWEGTYFDFDEDRILKMAQTAKNLGIELFVLDDGWFGKRNDDFAGLGDWWPNLKKLPEGIAGLSQKINELGLDFGLWFEPEMVNKDSDLYRNHPEWTLATPQRRMSPGRNQYVLDFSNPEVVAYIYKLMAKVIKEGHISYIKWDMNRVMSEVYSTVHSSKDQGKVMHQYILGVYRLYEMLIQAFPDILFESCASGGARFDPGMLYYAPQTWTSDDTDAIERLKIQYGTSLVYPLSSMGSHVSAVPNHQVGRLTPIETRANVAYFGTFGYELDLDRIDGATQAKIKDQIKFMKSHRELLQFGTFYRLRSPFETNETVWMVVAPDEKEAIVGYYRALNEVNVAYRKVKLAGLEPDFEYHVSLNETNNFGDELMNFGLIVSDGSSGEPQEGYNGLNGDYQSRLYHLKAR